MALQIKRIYEKPLKSDGIRILVDGIWPCGINKKAALLDDWLKEIAPSNELRKWFDHKKERFGEFSLKYREELEGHKDLVETLLEKSHNKTLTLLYGAKDENHNQAVVLRDFLEEQ